MKLSLVVPCYNEEGNIRAFYTEAKRVFDAEDYEYEIIFVNDGSRDKTQEELEKVYNLHETNIVIEMFSRNFGKEAAIYAGFQKASGDLVTVIDADLQQRPEIVVKMVKILLENEEYDCVAAYQEERHEGKMVGGLKNMFYKIINKTSEIEFYPGASDFRTFRRTVVDAILSLPEYHRFSKGIFSTGTGEECYQRVHGELDRIGGYRDLGGHAFHGIPERVYHRGRSGDCRVGLVARVVHDAWDIATGFTGLVYRGDGDAGG